MLADQDEKIEALILDLKRLEKSKLGVETLEKKAAPIVEKILTSWMARLNKLQIKVTDRAMMTEALSGIIIELLAGKAASAREELSEALYPVVAGALQKQMEEAPERGSVSSPRSCGC